MHVTASRAMTTSSAPASTDCPSCTCTSATVPSRPARSSFSIFIASTTTSGCRACDRVARLRPARGRPCPASARRRAAGPTGRAPPSSCAAPAPPAVERDRDRHRPDVHVELAGRPDRARSRPRGCDASTPAARPCRHAISSDSVCASMRAASTVPRRGRRRRPRNAPSARCDVDLRGRGRRPRRRTARQRSPSCARARFQRAPAATVASRPPAPIGRERAGDSTACSAAAIAATSSIVGVGSTNGRPLRAVQSSSRYVVWNRPAEKLRLRRAATRRTASSS